MKCIATIFFFVLITTVRGQEKTGGLKIVHLTAGFYVYTTWKNLGGAPFPSNSMYLVTGSGVVLFDTPWDSTQFQPLLDSINQRHHQPVVMCISTHFHSDRTAGLAFYAKKGIHTYSSLRTYELCRQHGEKQATHYFVNDTTFTVGNSRFSTYFPGEGHTADNIVIWFEKEKVLYGGCLVKSTENKELGFIDDANLGAWAPSIKNLMEKYPDAAFVIPGHFGWTDNHSLAHTYELLTDKQKQK